MKQFNKFIIIFCALSLISYCVFSQEPDLNKRKTLEDLIEDIASNSDEELDYTVLYDDLNYFLNNPLNLNEATEEDLVKLHFLNDFQIQSLLKYKEKFGKFLTIYELQLLNGYSQDDVERLLPFVRIGEADEADNFKLRNIFKYGNHQVFIRGQRVIEKQEGYTEIDDSSLYASPNSRYLGSPERIYTRYKYQYKDKIYWGFTAEKDPGEMFFKNNLPDTLKNYTFDDGTTLEERVHNGFDYYSFHLQVKDIGPIKTIALGDYQASFGQGLVLWSGMSYGKSPYVLNIRKKARKIRKYSSTDENLFLRGIGTTVALGNFDVSAFFSRHKIDANLSEYEVDNLEIGRASSFPTSGYHTTPGEIYDKDASLVTMFGGNVSYHHKKFKLGATYAYYQYGDSLYKAPNNYNQYDFTGINNYNVGLDYQFILKKINFFGEVAVSKNGGMAYLNGAMLHLAPQVAVSVLHRHYDRDYQALYGNGFAESKLQNESGLYIGAEILPIKKWKISAYFDMFEFPWARFRVYAPSRGVDYFVQVDYNPSRNLDMYFRFKQEIKQQNASSETLPEGDQSPVPLDDVSLMKLRYHLAYSVSKSIFLKSRIEYVRYQKGDSDPENGYMIYQDIILKPQRIPLSISLRYAVFDAPYNARIYAYENDILYAFSIPAYSNTGTRAYITLKYTITKGIDIWLRYSRFYFKGFGSFVTVTNDDLIGAGLTEIQGSTKSEIKAQVRFKF